MAITRVVINIPGETPYDMRIGSLVLDRLGSDLRNVEAAKSASRALVITDSNVAALYLPRVKTALGAAGYRTDDIVIPAGETSKDLQVAGEIWQAMAQMQLSRDCVVIALGGGVVGDLAGFVASGYMRGVAFVQAPTTLLSMLDSSVGGKTAINLTAGKNLVGSFYQPAYVCADTSVLSTLNAREWACGCAELVKMALLDCDDFFFWLDDAAENIAYSNVAPNEEIVVEAVSRAVVFKAGIVAADKNESKGVRECLNLGHTLGHAIETLAGFGTFSHGQAVAEGMRFAATLSEELCAMPPELTQAQNSLLDKLGLSTLAWSAPAQEVLNCMKGDKKARAGKLRFTLLDDIGSWKVKTVDDSTVLAHLNAWAQSKH